MTKTSKNESQRCSVSNFCQTILMPCEQKDCSSGSVPCCDTEHCSKVDESNPISFSSTRSSWRQFLHMKQQNHYRPQFLLRAVSLGHSAWQAMGLTEMTVNDSAKGEKVQPLSIIKWTQCIFLAQQRMSINTYSTISPACLAEPLRKPHTWHCKKATWKPYICPGNDCIDL